MKISNLFETLRLVGTFFAIFLGYQQFSLASYDTSLNIFSLLFVLSLSGLTGIESLFFGKQGSASIGRKIDRPYQLQSGVANLATAIMLIIVFVLNWGSYAKLTLVCTTLLFIFLSSCIHTGEIFLNKNTNKKNVLRPIFTLALLAAVIPLLIKYLSAM